MEHEIINNERALNRFLDRERMKNVALIRRCYPSMEDADIDNVYQDACIAMFTNIKSGKLTEFTSLPSTYFTQICRFQAAKFARDHKFMETYDEVHKRHVKSTKKKTEDEEDATDDYDDDLLDSLIDDDQADYKELMAVTRAVVKLLPHPCNEILWAYYESGLSLEEIAEEHHYKNAQTAKAKKSQCLGRLKQTISDAIKVPVKHLKSCTYANREKFVEQFQNVKTNDDEDR
ncbi:MAG: hypothetical protein LIP02_12445 [Bacteroidales bacterium]|nr:hypothetical protein [Bacteroidales bacterium]